MELFAPVPNGGNEVRRFEDDQMIGDGLARHIKIFAQVTERAPVLFVENIEQLATAGIGQRFEHSVHTRENMQPFGCMSRGFFFQRIGNALLMAIRVGPLSPKTSVAADVSPL